MPRRPPPTRREKTAEWVVIVVGVMLVCLMFGVVLVTPPSFWAALDLH